MSKNTKHYLFKEKYRPKLIDDYIASDDLKDKIKKWISESNIPHLLLHGKPGAGKTTLAKLIVENIDCDHLYINATDERSMDVMRDKVKSFASASTFKKLKIVILDEADYIRQDAQAILRNVIETFSLNTRFILTGNYVERIIEPIQSRCHVIQLSPPSRKDVAIFINNILEKENVKFELNDLGYFVNLYYPDVRKVIDEIQQNSLNGVLKLDKTSLSDSNYLVKVVEELKKPTFKSFNSIRQIIADSNYTNFDSLYRFLFDNTKEYASKNEGDIVLILAEMLYQSNFVVDREINIMSTISQILNKIK